MLNRRISSARRLVGTLAAALIGGTTLVALTVVVAPPATAAASTFASSTASAGRYGAARIARAGVAVYDRRSGSLWTGGDARAQVSAASTIKTFIAADLLYRNAHHTIRLSRYDYSQMKPMITRSSNAAADYLWRKYGGNQIVRDITARYRLTEIRLSPVAGFWGFTRMTAHDYALFLGKAADDPHIGPWLTATMSRSEHLVGGFDQWFGIPASGIRPFAIKQGWTCCDTGDILNSTGYVGTRWRYAVAIFTSGAAAHHRNYINTIAKLLLPGGYIPGDPRRNPFGGINTAAVTGNTVHIRGWSVDPDRTAAAVTVEISERTHRIYRAATNVLRARRQLALPHQRPARLRRQIPRPQRPPHLLPAVRQHRLRLGQHPDLLHPHRQRQPPRSRRQRPIPSGRQRGDPRLDVSTPTPQHRPCTLP